MPHYFSSSRVAAAATMSRWGEHENVHHEFCTTKHLEPAQCHDGGSMKIHRELTQTPVTNWDNSTNKYASYDGGSMILHPKMTYP